MSGYIQYELQALIYFLISGILLTAIYDLLRVVRRIIPHSGLVIGIQDLIFWIASGLFLFRQIFLKCDGSIRSFAVLGTILGAVVYHMTVSTFLVDFLAGILRIPVNGAVFLIKRLLFLEKRCKIFVYNLKTRLKYRHRKKYTDSDILEPSGRKKYSKRVNRFEKIKKQSRHKKKNPHGNGEHRRRRSDSVRSTVVRGTEFAEPVKLLPGKRGQSERPDRGREGADRGDR